VVIRCENPLRHFLVDSLTGAQPPPQIIGSRKAVDIVVTPSQKIVLNDAAAIRRIGELQAQDLGVLFRLLEPVARVRVD